MAYVWATWLDDVLRAGGCSVIEESGWKTRGRPASTGSFNPFGVIDHHTGTTTSVSRPHPTVGMCINGRKDLPGPLCHVVICYAGHCHVIAAGRANHAGPCNGWGPFVDGDGNWQAIGFEIDYNGTQRPSTAQMNAVYRANAAVLKKLGKPIGHLAGHSEISKTGKWDPGIAGKKVNMNTWRAETAKYMLPPKPPAPKPPTPPTPVPVIGDDMYLMISDGPGPSGTIYVAPADLSHKVPLDKPSYDAMIKVKGLYARIDISAAQLEAIPTIKKVP